MLTNFAAQRSRRRNRKTIAPVGGDGDTDVLQDICLFIPSPSSIFSIIELICLGLAAYYVYTYIALPIMEGIDFIKGVVNTIANDVKTVINAIGGGISSIPGL